MAIDNQIIRYLTTSQEATVNELSEHINVSRQMLHRVLNRMLDEGYVTKLGKPPKVFYSLSKNLISKKEEHSLDDDEINFIEEYFIVITETGKRLSGIEAMQFWCTRQKLPFEKTVKEFIITRKKYLQYFLPNGLIDGTE